MTDTHKPTIPIAPSQDPSAPDISGALPAPVVRPNTRRWLPSLVWLVPIVAAIIGLSLLTHSLMSRGPEITITFLSADGLQPGKTAVRYKDVDIGLLQSVHLAQDRKRVVATISLSPEARAFTAKDTRFWVVRPRLALSGVSGLNTLLSGAYIGVDAGNASVTSATFTGLEVPPIVTADSSGKQFVLHAQDLGSLNIGSPVFFRRVQVGQVVAYQLNPEGDAVTLRVFINKPYDRLVRADTRFWHASGIDLKLDAGGFKLSTQSLLTVALGGVAFQNPGYADDLNPASENSVFGLYDDETAALKKPDGPAAVIVLNFDQSVRGLSPGAPVDFRGVEVGSVRSIGIEYQAAQKSFRLPVVIEIYPDRMGLKSGNLSKADAKQTAYDIVKQLTQRGIRAQLRTGNLLTGQMYVALNAFPKARAVTLAEHHGSLPELATEAGVFDALQAQLGNILRRLDKVPIEAMAQDLHKTISSLNTVLQSADGLVKEVRGNVAPEVLQTLSDARKTLNAAETTLSGDAPLQQDARRTLQELTRTAQSLRTLTDYLERHPEALIRGKAPDVFVPVAAPEKSAQP